MRNALTRVLALVAACADVSPSFAQSGPQLGIGVHAGLSITGKVGATYSIQYVTDLAQTNNSRAWQCAEFLQLPASPYVWVDKSAPVAAKRFYRAVEYTVPGNLVFIPPGTFRMGSSPADPMAPGGPRTEVTISRGFWMGKYLVTQREYLAFEGNNPSYYTTNNGFSEDLSRPVENVSWSDARGYCWTLTLQYRAAGMIPPNTCFSLPTEAQWEYACRALTSTQFSYGDDPGSTNLTNFAWTDANSGGVTHAVGQKLPNPWGLYDMYGNVLQWCRDWCSGRLPTGRLLDPTGPGSEPSGLCVLRGGSSEYRTCDVYVFREKDYGFRIILTVGEPWNG